MTTTAPTARWGTIREAAAEAQLSVPTIRRYIKQGLIHAERYGRKLVRVDLNSLEQLRRPLTTERGEQR